MLKVFPIIQFSNKKILVVKIKFENLTVVVYETIIINYVTSAPR